MDYRQLLAGRETVTARVRRVLNLSSDQQADNIVNVVLESIVAEIEEAFLSNTKVSRFLSKNPSCWQAQDFRTCCRL